MSKKRQGGKTQVRAADDAILVRSFAVRHTSPHTIAPHSHDWHQLIYASEGVLWVRTAQGDWVVPPNRAVWVPAGVEHAIEMAGAVLVQTLYLSTAIAAETPRRCCAVNVTPLFRELIIHVVKLGMLDQSIPARARLMGVLLDLIETLPAIPLRLPSPIDPRARRVAAWLGAHPDDPGLIQPMAKRAATSPRTLERLFQRETGMTFGKWRQQLRLVHAMRLLAAGRPVTTVALDVGYDSPSAFIAMFRRTLGATPRRYFALSTAENSNADASR
jgi:AraC-like DNA-binding protein